MDTSHPKQDYTQTLPDGTAFDMIFVEGGTFMMGSAEDDPEAFVRNGEKGKHPVQLSTFYMGKYPVTQGLYKAVMDRLNPSGFIGDDRPVENVSWFDTAVFCNKLNEILGLEPCYYADKDFMHLYGKTQQGYQLPNAGDVFIRPKTHGYRLPTEAEWEYAARGGKHWEDGFKYAGSDKLKEVGWFGKNSHKETKPVGMKFANQLGICDMSGNVREWCQDWFDENYYKKCLSKGTVIDPLGGVQGSNRVRRGGGWVNDPQRCRVAYRNNWQPVLNFNASGFRLCLAPSSVEE